MISDDQNKEEKGVLSTFIFHPWCQHSIIIRSKKGFQESWTLFFSTYFQFIFVQLSSIQYLSIIQFLSVQKNQHVTLRLGILVGNGPYLDP